VIIAFCIPGRQQSHEFTKSWTQVVHHMAKNSITLNLYQEAGGDIYHIRNNLVSRDLPIPWDMMPIFGGEPYDYIMWIDSDVGEFDFSHIQRLIDADKDIITGVVPLGLTGRSAIGQYGYDEFGQPMVQYYNIPVMDKELDHDTPVEIEFCGYAFLLVRKGVFEAMEYPWFRYTPHEYACKQSGPGEDIGWCLRAREAGFKVWMHPGVRVSHNKEQCWRA